MSPHVGYVYFSLVPSRKTQFLVLGIINMPHAPRKTPRGSAGLRGQNRGRNSAEMRSGLFCQNSPRRIMLPAGVVDLRKPSRV